MTPPSCASPLQRAASRRLFAALAVSTLIHLSMPLFTGGGASRQPSASTAPRTLSVRVLPAPQPPVAQPLPPQLAAPVISPAAAPPVARAVQPQPRTQSRTPAVAPSAPAAASGAAAGLPEAPDLTYYATKQLDVYPGLLTSIDLKNRGKAGDSGVAGRALLLVLIDDVGTVKEVSVVEAEPANSIEEDARRAVMSARFSPGVRNGRAVRSRLLIEVNYGAERGSP